MKDPTTVHMLETRGPSTSLGKLRRRGQWDELQINPNHQGALGPASPAQTLPSMLPHPQGPADPV